MKKHARNGKKGGIAASILLHDIRSVHNVGSIFRTADAFGVSRIYISGYTPSPKDRFGRIRSDLAKVALGAEQTVPWEMVGGAGKDDVKNFIKKFKNRGGIIIVLEQDAQSVSFKEARKKMTAKSESSDGILIILGNEVDGVGPDLLDLADIIVEIPMLGKKESLNVSVAAGIALFGLAF